VIPYTDKILFGLVELTLLCVFLSRSGKKGEKIATPEVERATETK
jgi:hypothetical protein